MASSSNLYQQREKRPTMGDALERQPASSPPAKGLLQQKFIAARRRRTLVRRLALGAVAVYALLIGGLLLYTLGKPGTRTVPARPALRPAAVMPTPAPLTATEYERHALDQLRTAIAAWRVAPDKIRQARDLAQRGHQESARQALEQLQQEDPHNLELHLELAQLYLQKKDYQRAADLSQRVLNMDPARDSARNVLAMAYSQMGRHDQALMLAQWILDTNLNAALAHRIAAAAYQQQGHFDQELGHLRKWAALEPDNIEATRRVAEAQLRLHAYDQAQPLLEDIVVKQPDNAEAFRQLAVCYAQQKQAGKSVEILTRALALFGAPKISGWFGDKGFDAIRDQKIFSILQQQLSQPALAAQTARSGEERIDMNQIFDEKKANQLQELLKEKKRKD